MTDETEISEGDQWQSRWMSAVYDVAATLRDCHERNPWPDRPLLPQAMIYLMTEFWDRCFSQSEIRDAFEGAIAEMPRYAGGDETRS